MSLSTTLKLSFSGHFFDPIHSATDYTLVSSRMCPILLFNYLSLSYFVLVLMSAVTNLTNTTSIFHDVSWRTTKFHDFQGLENEIVKFHYFRGFLWPVLISQTMSCTQVNLALSETRPVNQFQAQKASGPSIAVVLSYDQRFLLRRMETLCRESRVLIIDMRKPKFQLDNLWRTFADKNNWK